MITRKAAPAIGVGFNITGQPTANAGAAFLVIIAAGKFQGVIIPTTPMGCLIVIILAFGHGDGIVSPIVRRHSSADHSQKLDAYVTSPIASATGFPFSALINFANST